MTTCLPKLSTAVESFLFNDFTAIFGYYSVDNDDKPQEKDLYRRMNICAALCWIPAIGSMIAGVVRIATIHKHTDLLDSTDRYSFSLRAGMELIGCGIIFAILDVIFYLGRLLYAHLTD